MIRLITYILINGIFSSALYLGLEQGIAGAANVAQFMAWWSFVNAVLSLLFWEKIVQHMRENPRSVPAWINNALDFCAIFFMVWHGWWWTGIAYAIHWILFTGLRADADKKVTP